MILDCVEFWKESIKYSLKNCRFVNNPKAFDNCTVIIIPSVGIIFLKNHSVAKILSRQFWICIIRGIYLFKKKHNFNGFLSYSYVYVEFAYISFEQKLLLAFIITNNS